MVKKERIELGEELRIFSPLEEKIMEFLWEKKEATLSEIAKGVNASMSSVAATLDRLEKNGFVKKEKKSVEGRRKFVFYPAVSKKDVEVNFVQSILDKLIDKFGDVVVDYFHRKVEKK
ncbi:transcriptional repressor, CopY family [Ferroglobus placidus DSM 10642]|uniref:Transcriptional repressor, CopY family n=1 Tax=Ferroglobus placidus (strain DSM 10642 / AEDII12DO) TaxID=589924 RepID=D3RX28_FERPA|nr:BlaI/MecI/CopY family transcriptional regulator [Ferroglobus placidus]ADC65041.1 transcriptional repressor, CopY family [Ferroglobus placidus DSM 10642]